MNPPAPSISVADIVSSPGFWTKLAADDDKNITPERQEHFLRGFMHQMEKAGASPFLVAGLLDGMSKEADATTTGYSVTPSGQIAPAPGSGHWWNNLKATSGGWWDKTRHYFGNNDPALISKIVNHETAQAHPIVSSIGSTIFKDPQQQAAFNVHLGNGDYMKAISMASDHIGASDMVKKWAPSVVPAIAAVGVGRLSGLGWGGSLALGAGAGFLGHQAHEVGGYKNLSNDVLGTAFKETPRPPPPTPAVAATTDTTVAGATPNATAPAPAAEGAANAGKNPVAPVGAAAEAKNTQSANAANAEKIRIPTKEMARFAD